eukprot:CAMPEP_0198138918 /NCGR_PEP_ID=MMETSP1443-20131203/2292_1 /TAXON_ID=186043 /ORGANISM="Entomoneis sp., Strain CCMP2396" /LENGTH=142 /DNA_ID=CAMNT_0043800875 /DNA_START=23 /DNA_END=451 /DNA_ORIENTATION=+
MGVTRQVITEGDGLSFPKKGDMLTMHYVGTLDNDEESDSTTKKEFDSSIRRGKPFEFVIGIGQVIQGWDEGILQMSLGETCTLRLSSDCGYGEQGAPPAIPPNANLQFQVTLLAIRNKKCANYDDLAAAGGGSSWSSYCHIL